MSFIVVDSDRFRSFCTNYEDPEILKMAANRTKIGYADESWAESARARSGARYLGWFYSVKYRCDVLVLNADGTLIT